MRLYADYLTREYGSLDSDYVLSRHPDKTICPEPGVILADCPAMAPGKAVFAGEIGIIFWRNRIVTDLIH